MTGAVMADWKKAEKLIADAWDVRTTLNKDTPGVLRDAVAAVLGALDDGALRVAEKRDGTWAVNQWIKQAILLSFRLNDNRMMAAGGDCGAQWFDKVPLKSAGWDEARFRAAGFRALPGSFVRHGAYIAPDAVVLPSFVNIGAHVGAGTMVDSWVTVGSCAQIGQKVHLSAHVMIGGVLEPLQATPVIIEDHCFIGACSGVAEGMVVEEGAVLGMGVQLGASTKIIDRATGEIFMGRVPAYSVVVPGSLPGKSLPDGQPGPALYCAVIVKRVDATTRAKTSINDLLRE
ncbi:MAG: 2,3,4,5-tetrahydropyridine-2,6-dicarboxylate N-succinyltransferase [Alphaproteobacteria bacterium]